MGRGGGGSGGRSGGGGSFGGSRSSGGHHGGSSSHRGGYSGGGSHMSHSSFSRPSGGGYYPGPSYHRTTVYAGGPGYYRRSSGSFFGAVISFIVGVMLLSLFAWVLMSATSGSDIQMSSINREPLDKQYVDLTGEWYKDDIGDWISDKVTLERGMRQFYDETGVAPYLYLTETVDGNTRPTETEMNEFANKLYNQLFTDEGHVLVIFQEYNSDGQYYSYYLAGKMAKTVLDDEAGEILLDYIDHYYYSDLTEDQLFAKAFAETGERMMTRTKSLGERVMMPILVIVIMIVGLLILKAVFKRKKEKAAETERILNTPVEHIGSGSSDLEDKYL